MRPPTTTATASDPPSFPTSLGPQRRGGGVNHCRRVEGGSLNRCPLSASRAFQPRPRLSADQTTPTPPPNMNPALYSPPPPSTSHDFLLRLPLSVCFCPSNLSCVLRQWSVTPTGGGEGTVQGGEKKWAFIFSTALVAPPTLPKKLKLNIHIALNDF